MTKFQEDEMYNIRLELSRNKKLEDIFQLEMDKTSRRDKYKHRPFFEQYKVSFDKAKKSYLAN